MLKWFKKKIVVILSAALILPSAGQLGNRWYSGQSVCAAETAGRTDEEINTLHLESNKTNQNYSIWGSCVKSYLSIDNGMNVL